MRNFLAVFFFLFSAFTLEAQIGLRPNFFTEETNPTNSNFEVYSQKNGLTRRASLDNIKKWVAPFFNPDTIAYIPTSWGNTTDLASFVYDSTGLLWYIDGQGDAVSFTTALGTDRNGFFDVANEGNTIAINTVVFDNLTLTQLNGDAQLQLGADIFDAIVESQAVIAGDQSILHLDTLGRAVIGVQLGTPESYVGFDNAVGDSIGLYVQINSALPTPGQTLIAGSDSLFRFADLSSDLNDLADVDTSGISIDNLLRWNGTDWVPVTTTQIIWEQALVYGQGLAGRTTYWDTDTTLNYTAINYSATEWNASALTGAVGVPSGTTSQRPTGAAGKMRYNSDLGDIEFYNGSAWRSVAESSANVFAPAQFIISNPAGILTDTTLSGALSMLGGVSGSGVSSQEAYWSGTSALTGHANFLWNGSSFSIGTTNSTYTAEIGTGGMRLAGQSANPTGASGVMFFDSDDNWYKGYNGTAYHFFARADDVDPGAGRIWFQNAGNTAQSTSNLLTWSGSQMTVNTASPVANMELTVAGNIYGSQTVVAGDGSSDVGVSLTGGTGMSVGVFRGSTSGSGGPEQIKIYNHSNAGNEGHTAFYGSSSIRARVGKLASHIGVFVDTLYPLSAGNNLFLRTWKSGVSGIGNIYVWPESGQNEKTGGSLYVRAGGLDAESNGSVVGTTGNIYIQLYRDHEGQDSSASIRTMQVFRAGASGRTNWEVYRLNASTTGMKVLTMEDDTVKYRVENIGAISTTTDGSGDVTVTHGMGATPTVVLVTPTGTTPWIVSVHTIGATTFKVRFYDAAGAAVTTTAVTATWLGKT